MPIFSEKPDLTHPHTEQQANILYMNSTSVNLESFQYLANDGPFLLEPIQERDTALLIELREILVSNGMENRFGISLINLNVRLGASEVTMEVSDHQERLSLLRVIEEGSLESEASLPTNWHFRGSGQTKELKCLGYCKYENYRHPKIHRGIRGLLKEETQTQQILSYD